MVDCYWLQGLCIYLVFAMAHCCTYFQIYAEIGGHIQTQRLEIYYNNYLYNVVLLLYIINYITYLVYKLLEEGGYGK